MTDKMKIVYKKTNDLIPYARNSRTHSEIQINQIASSIREFGFRVPVIIDGDNGIIAGHGRVLAAIKLGINEIPTIDASDMNEAKKKAFIIADNKIAINAGWDEQLLMLEIEDLKSMNADLSILAFSDKEISNILGIFDEDDEIKEPIDENRNLIMIELISERECENLFSELQERGFNCKIMS